MGGSSTSQAEAGAPALKISGLTFNYGNSPALENVSLEVERGGFLGLIGPNGSGKTTLAKIICGILPFSKGSVEVLGVKYKGKVTGSKSIAYVPQKINLDSFFPLTVYETISLGIRSASLFNPLSKHAKQEVERVMKELGLAQFAKKNIGELSGGQLQRVLLAKALVSSPKILVLDEPTSGIDATNQTNLAEILIALNRKGTAVILVSHDLSFLTVLSKQVICLNRTVHYCGVPSKLDQAALRKVYGTDVSFVGHTHTHEFTLGK
ncbi:MAG: metal ABC transporter ATP-binding protein [Candidatus Micrarchaeia archaeon]